MPDSDVRGKSYGPVGAIDSDGRAVRGGICFGGQPPAGRVTQPERGLTETPGPRRATSSGFSARCVLDPEGERRSSTMQDLVDVTRLIDGLNHRRAVLMLAAVFVSLWPVFYKYEVSSTTVLIARREHQAVRGSRRQGSAGGLPSYGGRHPRPAPVPGSGCACGYGGLRNCRGR